MSLPPSEPDTSAAEEAAPRVIGVDSEDADDVLSALTAETARELLSELHDEPGPPAELAERVDTSLQNAQYHLNKLEDAGAIEVVDTIYSEKGREMSVYAPARHLRRRPGAVLRPPGRPLAVALQLRRAGAREPRRPGGVRRAPRPGEYRW